MDLRYRLAVVTGAGAGPGRVVAVALSRRGASVLAVDRDLSAAEETSSLVREARVRAWSLQVDLAEDAEVQLLAARGRDLGGVDLLVTAPDQRCDEDEQWPTASPETWSRTLDLHLGVPIKLTQLFLEDRVQRRDRGDGSPAVVHVGPAGLTTSPGRAAAAAGLVGFTRSLRDPALSRSVRVMAVLADGADQARTSRVVVDLLGRGKAGEVVELSGAGAQLSRPGSRPHTSGSHVTCRPR